MAQKYHKELKPSGMIPEREYIPLGFIFNKTSSIVSWNNRLAGLWFV
ncbi:hypothetical protein SAMN04487970_102537 [Paenibacillus tianmuensis]|uniref:Uncharacterized protein n=1 Tax=Paenibacillus tianmuensis TaxID=624147 RepID=A0A1G4S9S9_9BACL|nr:hypothetical protein [Paenibacillus tianmuensis]SCW65778.1 hypothetical protein SAMN04487970_102537 [Paenibacillus tianmuensis]